MPLTITGELSAIERAALEHYGAARSNLNEPAKAEAVAQTILDESLQQAIKVYLTEQLPKLTDLGQRFLNLPRDKQGAVLEILGATHPPEVPPTGFMPLPSMAVVSEVPDAAPPIVEPEK